MFHIIPLLSVFGTVVNYCPLERSNIFKCPDALEHCSNNGFVVYFTYCLYFLFDMYSIVNCIPCIIYLTSAISAMNSFITDSCCIAIIGNSAPISLCCHYRLLSKIYPTVLTWEIVVHKIPKPMSWSFERSASSSYKILFFSEHFSPIKYE